MQKIYIDNIAAMRLAATDGHRREFRSRHFKLVVLRA
jgi:hypothetical protein